MKLALSQSDNWTASTEHELRPQHEVYESIFASVTELRQSIKNGSFLLRKLRNDRQSIVDYDSSLFWACVPLLLKNFIGLLTQSDQDFHNFQTNHRYYDLFKEDLFIDSLKQLKVSSISYDIMNAQNEKVITPKHLHLANELFHHTRSANLLKITNRLGHTCGYDTIIRLAS